MKPLVALALVVGAMCTAAGGHAQATPAGPSVHATRADLEARLVFLEQVVASSAYSAALERRAGVESAAITERLRRGDFQVGDRVFVQVEAESALTDTFTVAEGPQLLLPVVGDIPLDGVLRAELETHLTTRLARFVRQPRVRARSLIRLAVDGAVARPGFVTVPSEIVLADVLTAAGGAGLEAQVDQIEVVRNNRTLLAPADVEVGLREGRTIDQLGLQAGDRVVVPRRGRGLGALEGPLRALSILLGIPFTIIALGQLF